MLLAMRRASSIVSRRVGVSSRLASIDIGKRLPGHIYFSTGRAKVGPRAANLGVFKLL